MSKKHLPALLSILLSLLTLATGRLTAQAKRSDAPVPFVGFAVGPSSMPDAFKGCGLSPRTAAEIRVGLSRGTAAVEGRGAVMTSRSGGLCQSVLPEEFRQEGDLVSYVEYPFDRSDVHASGEVRLRYTPPTGLPLVVAGGVGWLVPQDIPYLVSSVGLRTGNWVRFALDLDHTWFRVPYDRLISEWAPAKEGWELVRHHRHDWRPGVGVRLGVEIPLRPGSRL